MAAEVSSMPVNGNYAPHQGYGGLEQQNSSYAYGNNMSASSQQPSAPAAAPPSTAGSTTSQPTSPPSKDEVGWYFVEQYYTTLSRNPEKVYLFYNKRSQFVSGQETDKVAVCVGQRAINDRIKELGFQDTKVRVTNVDSQASDSNIVIQVIGEISNKSQPHRKFVQTFILATQTNGYFVLNDIFRYLVEEEDEPEQESAPAQEEEIPQAETGFQEPPPTVQDSPEPKTLTSSVNPAEVENDAQKVDKQLKEHVSNEAAPVEEAPSAAVNGVSPAAEEVKPAEDAPVAAPEPASTEAPKAETKDADLQAEKPTAPEPTPAASPPKQAPAQPAPTPKPAAPAVPKTWASLAASANKAATPAAPSSSASSQTSSQPKAAPQSKPAAPATPSAPSAPTPPTAPAAQREESPAASSQDEWTAVGGSHNRQQSRQVNQQQQQQQQQGPQTRAYIKNVYESVKEEDLRARLAQFGEMSQCEVSRVKSAAFVDFKSPEGYNAAVANNPHVVNGERLYVVERHGPRPGQAPYNPRGQNQGGRGGRGSFAGGQGDRGGRGGAQGGGRGNFSGAGRGRGGPAPRGGATSQAI